VLLDVAEVVPRTEAEGPGWRWALWVQGCPLRCPGCCNPEMLRFGRSARQVAPEALADEVADVEGVSFLGGEPFAQAEALAVLARLVRARGLSVMVFSGFTLAELRERPGAAALLAETDLLVDGRYDRRLRTTARRWIGSENQVLHFLTDRYRPDDLRFREPNHVELRWDGRTVTVNGFPSG
jgi:anaerobic ribonucleoside-triphosphate reductase activating protein